MKIISIITQKGGVGKTTTSIHLGASFAEAGKKTLLIDFDAQTNLSIGNNINSTFDYNVKHFLNAEFSNFALTQKNDFLYILSGDKNIEQQNYSRDSLSKSLKILEQLHFDFVIIDCPPRPLTDVVGLGEIALNASDFVLSPILAEKYSIAGINELIPSINRIKAAHNPKLTFLGFFFNMVNENTINFKKYHKIAQNEAKNYFFNAYIRQDVNIEKAKEIGTTVYTIAPKCRASQDYRNLVTEIINKIGKNGKSNF